MIFIPVQECSPKAFEDTLKEVALPVAEIRIWAPDEELISQLRPGQAFQVTTLTPLPVYRDFLSFSTSRKASQRTDTHPPRSDPFIMETLQVRLDGSRWVVQHCSSRVMLQESTTAYRRVCLLHLPYVIVFGSIHRLMVWNSTSMGSWSAPTSK